MRNPLIPTFEGENLSNERIRILLLYPFKILKHYSKWQSEYEPNLIIHIYAIFRPVIKPTMLNGGE